jgi:DNA-binding NarL/FixJ family response regulator
LIRVAIVSPNRALRIGLRELLSAGSDLATIGEAERFEELNGMEAEVILLASVPLARVEEITFNNRAVLLLTDDAEDAKALLRAEPLVWGALSLNATEDEILAGVRALAEGLIVGAPRLMSALLRREGKIKPGEDNMPVEPLTARELETLQLTAEGLANKQIALALGVSEHTVKFHLSSLYAKLNASGRTEAAKIGLRLGLISI